MQILIRKFSYFSRDVKLEILCLNINVPQCIAQSSGFNTNTNTNYFIKPLTVSNL